MEKQTRLIELVSWKLTIDSINEISTILMLEKTQLLNEKMILWKREWDSKPVDINWEAINIIKNSLHEAKTAGYSEKAKALQELLDDPIDLCTRFEEIEKKRPFIL